MNEFKIIIDYLMKAAISSMGVIVGYFIAKNKYVFEKTYDRKSILIVDLYAQVVQLEFELKKYIYTDADMAQNSLTEKKEFLNNLKNKFHEFQHKFWEIEIILDDSTTKKINLFLRKYIEIMAKLSTGLRLLNSNLYDEASEKFEKSFDLFESDLVVIKNELKKDFKNNLHKKLV